MNHKLHNPKLEAVILAVQDAEIAWCDAGRTVFNYTRPEYVKRIAENFDDLRGAVIELDELEHGED